MEPQSSCPTVLVVDDEKMIRELLRDFLSLEGFRVILAGDVEAALSELQMNRVDVMLSDLKMPGRNGIDLLKDLRQLHPEVVPILMTAFGTLDSSIAAIQQGAHDYILKPFKVEEVIATVRRALEKKQLEDETRQIRETLQAIEPSHDRIHPLTLVLETTFNLLHPHAVVLFLHDPLSSRFEIREFRAAEPDALEKFMGRPDLDRLRQTHERNERILGSGGKSEGFFKTAPSFAPLHQFASIPVRGGKRLLGFLNIYQFSSFPRLTEAQCRMLSMLAARAGAAVENALLVDELKDTFRQTIEGFARSLEAKDSYTAGHSSRVKIFTSMITDGYKLQGREREIIIEASLLHDVGKLCVDLTALNNPGHLTTDQVDRFRSHPVMGKNILQPISFLAELVPLVLFHHENYDGSGYPDAKTGKEIPFGARIIAVADSYDAMTSNRVYRRALGHETALKELKRFAGSQFDPEIVDIFLEEVQKNLRDEKILSLLENLTPNEP